ncbi:MAG TPA: hypothetical protein VFJ58_03780 [Armatimonadota bacterium]|nr:hypothetical protein [Armatimonadota bacterium]
MRIQASGVLVALSVSAVLAAAIPAGAMPPAQTAAGYQTGVSLGVSFDRGTKLAGAGDIGIGIRTDLLNRPYTEIVADALSVGTVQDVPPTGNVDLRGTIITLGVRQPVPIPGPVPFSLEGGLSYLDSRASGSFGTITNNPVGGFFGARASLAHLSAMAFNGMVRYHTESGGFYQVGAGFSGPLPGFDLNYEIDYYHTGGGDFLGFNNQSDTILAGARFSGNF